MEMSFAAACKEYFGIKEGQSLHEFSMELKKLSQEDREEIKKLLTDAGYDIKA